MVRQRSPQVIKVRFAPSPTGIPHIGNTRTALFNFLFAKHGNGKFILRIEDTDQKRIVKGAEEAILEILSWLGIEHDREVVHQSERLDIYKKHKDELLFKKIAYEKEGAVWVKMPKEKHFEWEDLVGNKKIKFEGDTQEDFVILKSDGFPTYHLANVVDDHLMGITHVIRGEEWISSTPKHFRLYESFGWNKPEFAHLPVILGPDRSKLSKRHGAKSVLDYRDEGFLKEALLNFMALLGWNPGEDREIMDLKTMIDLFDIKDINTGNPIFDIKKLEWMNGEYLRKTKDPELKNLLLKFDPKIALTQNFEKYIPLAKTRMRTLSDFKALIKNEIPNSLTNNQKHLAKALEQSYKNLSQWSTIPISTATISVQKNLGVPMKDVYTVLTGKPYGLPFSEKLEIQGKSGTMSQLEKVLKK